MTTIEITAAGTAGDVITLSDAQGQRRTLEIVGGYGLTVDPANVPVRPGKTAAALATALLRAARPFLKLAGTIHDRGEAGALLVLEVEPGPVAPEPPIGTGAFKVLEDGPELPPAPPPASQQLVTIMCNGQPTWASAKTRDVVVWR